MFVEDALAFQGRQAAQLHVEDRAGLDLGQREARAQLAERRLGRRGAADERDDVVDVVQGDDQALQDVRRSWALRSR